MDSNQVTANDCVSTDTFTAINGDCVEALSQLPDNSIDYSVSSPPFSSLYRYSDSENDFGNVESDEEFFDQFSFLIDQLYRLIKPGRLISMHVMNLPSTITRHGYIGIRDFRGDVISAFIDDESKDMHRALGRIEKRIGDADGERLTTLERIYDDMRQEIDAHACQTRKFTFHSEVCIWKDPVTAMQRTKALGLLHKQVLKDSAMSRQGIPDYVLTFRKPGVNANPVSGPFEYFSGDESTFENTGNLSIDIWQRYASPVWMDIRQSRTLNNYREGRDDDDIAHICPLQLDVIERCLQLWSKPDDVVLSPFMGIGSEGHEAIRLGRKFVGTELKESYFDIAVKNLRRAEQAAREGTLFQ